MFENIVNFFKRLKKSEESKEKTNSKDKAKERLHLVLMQDRANVSADFLEMMKQEIIDVIKKYVEVDEKEIDVRLTNELKDDGTTGAPSLYANIPIVNIRNEMKKETISDAVVATKAEEKTTEENKIDEEKKHAMEPTDGKSEEQEEKKDEDSIVEQKDNDKEIIQNESEDKIEEAQEKENKNN